MTAALFTTVLVGSDGSDTAAQAVERAATFVSGAGDGTLEIVGACGNEGQRSALEAKLSTAADQLRARGIEAGSRVIVGDPSDVLLATATELSADLIVVGSKGMTGARRFLHGSVPDKVSHKATCSVLIASTV